MAKIAYVSKRLAKSSMAIIEQANDIIKEYSAQGFDLTLRQLYYQFVARDLIPNEQRAYKRLGSIVNDGRLAGLIDWNAIEDRTRHLRALSHWDNPAGIVASCAHQFRVDKWRGQDYRPEVWIEKDALVGVIQRVCSRLDVPYFSCRGYVSQSSMWRAAQRMERHLENGQTPHIIHLGDHDPSGVDMSRDIKDRLELFLEGLPPFEVDRVALTMEQVEEHDPPPNPAKLTDARAKLYIAEYGRESWELDALDPATLENLIEDKVLSLRRDDLWAARKEEEKAGRERLWEVVTELRDGA